MDGQAQPRDWIRDVEAGATILTASDRLSRQLHQQFADYQLAAGREAWSRPDILPETAFWRRLLERLQEDGEVAAMPLGSVAAAAWWEQVVSDSFREQPLLAPSGAARSAQDAWTLVHEWRLDPQSLAADFLDDARLLHQWGSAFEQACEERQWISRHRLADVVIDALAGNRGLLPDRLLLAGFIDITPAAVARHERLRALGVEVVRLDPPRRGRVAGRLACDDARDEHRRIAAWAAGRLAENPDQRIAVVVPDLAERRNALRRALLDSLAPDWLPEFSGRTPPFNFSLGEPLAARALVRSALDWLQVLEQDKLEFVAAARLLRSPYLSPVEEVVARHALEGELRERGFAEFTLRDLAWLAENGGCEQLAVAIRRGREALRDARSAGPQLPSEWARTASSLLSLAGWCRNIGRSLDSGEYQARDAFNGLLGRLAELDETLGRQRFGTVLLWLRRMASETLFQPRAADAPVQVLGLLEATGMSFDAAWIAGLDDETLPAAPHPNPFLPLSLQRAHRLPQSSARRELEFARQLFDGLLQSAPVVVCSHARMDGDAERSASPLIEHLPDIEPPAAAPGVAETWLASGTMETLDDHQGAPLATEHASGGTGLLADQSACAFRAYANHRLAAGDWPTPEPGPDAMLRGSLLHSVLERVWRRWQSQDELARRHAAGEVAADIREAVDAVIDRSLERHRHRWRDSLAGLERERLAASLLRWIEQVELQRPPFRLLEIEGLPAAAPPPAEDDHAAGKIRFMAGPVRLSGKLDRVDELPDGSQLVIDYKTGLAPSPAQFFGSRPRAPQLPAYAISRRQNGHPSPAGIAVAILRPGQEGLKGILKTDDPDASSTGVAGLQPLHKVKADGITDWDAALAEWEQNIARLGEEFAAGHAGVDPAKGACDYCHLAALCRIHAHRAEDALSDGPEREGGDD